jgi:hypothetical protein
MLRHSTGYALASRGMGTSLFLGHASVHGHEPRAVRGHLAVSYRRLDGSELIEPIPCDRCGAVAYLVSEEVECADD